MVQSFIGTVFAMDVSVPLRGYGFEMCYYKDVVEVWNELFPSPCGDMVLK